MPLSPAVVQELQAELEQLEAQAQAIRKIIGQEQVTRQIPLPNIRQSVRQQGMSASDTGSEEKPSVKATVLGALRELPPGAKPSDVTRLLRQRGYKPGGDTKLSHRVYNEIWRAFRAGELKKTPNGGYTFI